MSLYDDWDGTRTCNKCGFSVKTSDLKEQKMAKPKETKVEAQARLALEQAAAWVTWKQEYPVRFLSVMYGFMDAAKVGAPFSVVRDADEMGTFHFKSNLDWKETFELYMPGDEYDRDLVEYLVGAEHVLTRYAEQKAEEVRQQQAYSVAYNKLTKDERELLGVK